MPTCVTPGSEAHDGSSTYTAGRSKVSMETVTLLNVKFWDLLACPNCGDPTPSRAGRCCSNKGKCRVALHRWRKAQARAAQDARRPVVRIGARSLKALRGTCQNDGARRLRASSVITTTTQTPANVKVWASSRVRRRMK